MICFEKQYWGFDYFHAASTTINNAQTDGLAEEEELYKLNFITL